MNTSKTKRKDKIIAVYRGDELLVIGTPEQCADALEMDIKTILYYMTRTGQERSKKAKRYERQIFVVDVSN